uniref:Uncharacterized protein n=1 Tax=Ixodes ricinus TaxID=34613 RepID=A0A6B0UNM8_IXORI
MRAPAKETHFLAVVCLYRPALAGKMRAPAKETPLPGSGLSISAGPGRENASSSQGSPSLAVAWKPWARKYNEVPGWRTIVFLGRCWASLLQSSANIGPSWPKKVCYLGLCSFCVITLACTQL